MNPRRNKLGPHAYLGYVLVACVVGAGLFFYELHVNNEPLLQVSPAHAVETAPMSAHFPKNQAISPLSLIVVRTLADQERGLGDRASLPADEGMLFVFATSSDYGIWMKDMQFSIDIISLDKNFSVTHVEPDVSPDTYPNVFFSPSTTQYIIETNAGWAQKNNIQVGDTFDFAREAVNN